MMRIIARLGLASLVGLVCAQSAHAQSADPCQMPGGLAAYYTQPPPECALRNFNPYALPPTGQQPPTGGAIEVAPSEADSLFLFTGGAVNAWTLTYLDLWNAAYAPQTVKLAFNVNGKTVATKNVELEPQGYASIDVTNEPGLKGGQLTFSLKVTFAKAGVATLKVQPANDPWSIGQVIPPRVVDLRAGR